MSSNAEVAGQAPTNAKAAKDGMKQETLTDSVHQIYPKKLRAAADQAMAIIIIRNINQQQKKKRKRMPRRERLLSVSLSLMIEHSFDCISSEMSKRKGTRGRILIKVKYDKQKSLE